MLVKDIFDSLQSLEIYESRCLYDHYGELVFEKKNIDQWIDVLSNSLGGPKKPANENPTEEDLKLTANYRGIRRDQTLFYKKFEDHSVLAMFWPWSSSYVTLIVAYEKEKG